MLHYVNSAPISFAEVLTSSGQLQKPTKLRIHLAIISDRVVTETWEICRFGPSAIFATTGYIVFKLGETTYYLLLVDFL